MDRLRALAARQGGVFTLADARTCGLSEGCARTLIRRGTWVAIRRGVYAERVVVAEQDPRVALALSTAAALRAYAPERFATAHSAACIFGLELLGDIPRKPSLVLARDGSDAASCRGRGYRKGGPRTLVNHLPTGQRARVFGLPCVSLARAVADLARVGPLAVGVVAMDSAARQFGLGQDDVRAAVSLQRGWPYARLAQTASELMDERSESVLESFGRTSLRGWPFAAAQCQVWVGEFEPEFRVDLKVPGMLVVGEADGRVKYAQAAALWEEKKRQDRIEDLGGVVVRFDWAGASDAGRLVGRFVAAAERARAVPASQRRLRVFPDPPWWTRQRQLAWAAAAEALDGTPWWLRGLPGY